MTLLPLVVTLLFTAFVLYKAITPFLEPRETQWRKELLDSELQKIEHLVALRTSYLNALREIEIDRHTEKISDKDYQQFKTSYERRTVAIMRQLDAIHGGRGWEENINDELQKRLAQLADTNQPINDHGTPDLKGTSPNPNIACPQCHESILATARFCSHCGFALTRSEQSTYDNSAHNDTRSSANAAPQPETAR